MVVLAKSPEEVRAVLGALEGEHRPTKKAYYSSAVTAILVGVVGPIAMTLILLAGDASDPRWWRSIASAVIGPLLAFEIVRTVMATYVINESQVTSVSAIGIGSWTMFRVEIEGIDALVGPTGMSLRFRSSAQGVKLLPLRKRHRYLLMRMYPEIRKAKLRATAEERAEKRKSRLYLALLALFFVLAIVMVWVIVKVQ